MSLTSLASRGWFGRGGGGGTVVYQGIEGLVADDEGITGVVDDGQITGTVDDAQTIVGVVRDEEDLDGQVQSETIDGELS